MGGVIVEDSIELVSNGHLIHTTNLHDQAQEFRSVSRRLPLH